MPQTIETTPDELTRRHRAATMIVWAMIALVLILVTLAFGGIGMNASGRLGSPNFAFALRVVIIFLGLGAVALRRTRFSSMRLQDIAGLRGITGLLATLQNTTTLVALIGGAIAIIGFVIAMTTGEKYDMVWIGLAALAVLFYAYPRRASWQNVVDRIQQTGDPDVAPAKGNVA